MADNINDINKEIAELRAQLGKVPDNPFNLSELSKAKEALNGLRFELREMSGDLDYISKSFKESVEELSKQNTYLQSARKSLTGISDISKKLVDFRRGENNLSDKQLSTLKDQARVNFEQLKVSIDSGKLKGKELLEAQDSYDRLIQFNKAVDRTLEIQGQVNKEVGLLGQGLEGAGKFLEKMGFAGISKPISDAIQKTKDARRQILYNNDAIIQGNEAYKQNAQQLRTLSGLGRPLTIAEKAKKAALQDANKLLKDNEKSLVSQNKELSTQTNKYKNILSSLKEQLTMTNLVDGAITKIVSEYFNVNKAAVDYQRLTGQNATAMAGMNSSLATSAQVLTLMAELTKQTGIAAGAIFSADDLGRLAEAQNLLGLSAEQAGNLGIRSKLAGKSIEDYEKGIVASTNNYNKLNNNAISHGVVMQDVLNTSDDIALSLGNNDTAITKAASAARGLGLSLEKVDQIASSLMDFETSIGYELEAQLLTGKEINLSKAREYALTNNLAGLSEELKKNGASAAEFANMGRIEQEGLAKALGMSRGELAKSIMMQETAKNLTDEQRANAMGVTVDQMKQMDIQAKIEQSLAKLAQAFSPILDAMLPIVEAVIAVIGPVAKMVASLSSGIAPFIKYLTIGYGILKGMQLTFGSIATLQTFITASKASDLGLGLSILANLGFQNAAKAYQNILGMQGNRQAAIRAGLEQTILGKVITQGYNLIKNVGQYIVTNALAAGRAIMESTILGSIIAQGYNLIKNVGQYIVTNALAAGRAIMESTILGSIIAQGIGILRNIGQLVVQLAVQMGLMGAAMATNAAVTLGIGVAIAVAAAAAGYAAIKSMTADDAISPGYGKRTMMSPEGAIQFNDKDTIVAGTNLFGGEEKQGQTQSVSSVLNISPLVEEMQGLRAEMVSLIQVIKQGGHVYMDTNKVGKALKLGNFSIQ